MPPKKKPKLVKPPDPSGSQINKRGDEENAPNKRRKRSDKKDLEARYKQGSSEVGCCPQCCDYYSVKDGHSKCKIKIPGNDFVSESQTIRMGFTSVLHPDHKLPLLRLIEHMYQEHWLIKLEGTRLFECVLLLTLEKGDVPHIMQNDVRRCLSAACNPVLSDKMPRNLIQAHKDARITDLPQPALERHDIFKKLSQRQQKAERQRMREELNAAG